MEKEQFAFFSLMQGLDVNEKYIRVANYHKNIILSFVEMLAAASLTTSNEIQWKHILHRTGPNKLESYQELYPETV